MKKYPIIAFSILVVFAAIFGFCSSSSSTTTENEEISNSEQLIRRRIFPKRLILPVNCCLLICLMCAKALKGN